MILQTKYITKPMKKHHTYGNEIDVFIHITMDAYESLVMKVSK